MQRLGSDLGAFACRDPKCYHSGMPEPDQQKIDLLVRGITRTENQRIEDEADRRGVSKNRFCRESILEAAGVKVEAKKKTKP